MSASQIPVDESAQRGPGLQCSECRTVLRTYYYALDDRPVCARCRETYAHRIERGTGAAALGRSILYGLGAAIAGAVLIGLVILVFGFGRILCSIAIGYMVGTAIKKANGGWPGRRFQILAVVLTYFAIGLGSLSPIIKASGAVRREIRQAADSAAADRARAAADTTDDDDSDDEDSPPATRSTDDELSAIADSMQEARARPPRSADAERAAQLAEGHFFSKLVALVTLIFTLPLLSLFMFGLYGAVVSVFAFGYGMKRAWDLTAGATELTLSGPFKVGEGPVMARF